jgi:hypothetical protein
VQVGARFLRLGWWGHSDWSSRREPIRSLDVTPQVFHTPTRNITVMHPSSVFYSNAEFLAPVNDARELLCYTSVLVCLCLPTSLGEHAVPASQNTSSVRVMQYHGNCCNYASFCYMFFIFPF